MASVFDVAAYILEKTGPVSAWKLQKLIYYSQAWVATWRDSPLFESKIEAWANGPVCPDLYAKHRGMFKVGGISGGDASLLSESEADDVLKVVEFYSQYNGQQLSDITHAEKPWLSAREGLGPSERGNHEITLESMSEYYGSLK
ncbi:Panacea domain-containing protein [Antarcticimicrobium luteum]|uniref:DUF4065 domain-containing protein n=1 Tax=Antarcticimicrobium luteum TaxID=2547397 RepID=A0A4R5UXQ7_9RHOB|nr:type II toxin-antitoxin system antitoxin SocA domain-containing protein [Antarcticimicrobium luteum]TDK43866.1 DUF4065 domain-containing protein [Antarcticimicrobium luteum]